MFWRLVSDGINLPIAFSVLLPQNKRTYFSNTYPADNLFTCLFICNFENEKNKMAMDDNNQIIIYQSDEGETRLEVKFTGETVWLSQQQMADLFQSSRSNVVEHIKHIYEEGELDEDSTCRNFRQVRQEGTREVTREIPFYNLDMIISLGYRIKSLIATHFRRWAAERLKEYIIKGFTMDDERLKGNGGGAYWRELLDRIRDIRSSEKVMYRQVLDLYATAVDYDPRSAISVELAKRELLISILTISTTA